MHGLSGVFAGDHDARHLPPLSPARQSSASESLSGRSSSAAPAASAPAASPAAPTAAHRPVRASGACGALLNSQQPWSLAAVTDASAAAEAAAAGYLPRTALAAERLPRLLSAGSVTAGSAGLLAAAAGAPHEPAAPPAAAAVLAHGGVPDAPAATAATLLSPSALAAASSVLGGLPASLLPLVIAKSTTRRGKGGRQPASDPRLEPGMDPKKAKRILANRQSAARSKLKQKLLVEGLKAKREVIQCQQAAVTAEMEALEAQLAALEAENEVLEAEVQSLQLPDGSAPVPAAEAGGKGASAEGCAGGAAATQSSAAFEHQQLQSPMLQLHEKLQPGLHTGTLARVRSPARAFSGAAGDGGASAAVRGSRGSGGERQEGGFGGSERQEGVFDAGERHMGVFDGGERQESVFGGCGGRSPDHPGAQHKQLMLPLQMLAHGSPPLVYGSEHHGSEPQLLLQPDSMWLEPFGGSGM